MRTKKQRIAAFLILIMIVLVALSGLLCVTVKECHDCVGDSCSVCCTVQRFEGLCHGSEAPKKAAAVFIPILTVSVVIFMLYKCFETRASLVSLKVKLSN
ncbi:MAG: hypothetical protein ACI4JB_05180 [Porcipelethomonas sp.]